MSIERIVTTIALGVIGVATLTTILGRKNTPKVIDSLGGAFSGSIGAALGKGVNIQ